MPQGPTLPNSKSRCSIQAPPRPSAFSNQRSTRVMSMSPSPSISPAAMPPWHLGLVTPRTLCSTHRFVGSFGDAVPVNALLVHDGDQVESSVAVDIRREIVVRRDRAGLDATPGAGITRVAGVAEPGPSGDLVDPAIAVDIHRHAADVGQGVIADLVRASNGRGLAARTRKRSRLGGPR